MSTGVFLQGLTSRFTRDRGSNPLPTTNFKLNQMNPITHKVTIQPAKNGFLVFINEDHSLGTIRPIPYVFETMPSLLNFIREELSSNEQRKL